MFRLKFFKYIKNTHLNSKIYYSNTFISNSVLSQNLSYSKITHVRKLHNLTSLKSNLQNFEKDNREEASLTEKEFVAQLKNNPDIFGPRSGEEVKDEGDIAEEKHFTEQVDPRQRLTTKKYADIIKSLLRKRKIKEAIDVLELRIIKEDKVKPENYIYNLILGGCGRVGYTKKAFQLYNDMKKRGLKVTGGTYTALFNACANSPWPETDGLTRANHLRNVMIEKQYNPNDTNYNAMIKAFGRCGDLPTAFSLVDEMITKKIPVKDSTINFLLQACITDKEAGFRHSLLVWRKLVQRKIRPSVYTYNLMLRSIRDCGLGDLETTTDVINRIISSGNKQLNLNTVKQITYNKDDVGPLNTGKISVFSDEQNKLCLQFNSQEYLQENIQVLPDNAMNDFRPNLMADVPYLGNIISLSEVIKPEDRLLLVGGCSGFLKNMEEHKCTPDIKTFTQMLDTIPGTIPAEKELMTIMKKLKVKPDIDFYNMLIKKRSMRCDYDGAREVLKLIKKINYYPDLLTYGVLSLGCKNKEEALDLIQTMKESGYRLNAEILGAMLHQACYHFNYNYVLEIMEICLREDVQPNKQFLEQLNKFYNVSKDYSNSKKLTNYKEKLFVVFKKRYKIWLTEIKVDENEEAHPWQQFRQNTVGNEKYFKPKDTARFKARHNSMFRVKTSAKVKE